MKQKMSILYVVFVIQLTLGKSPVLVIEDTMVTDDYEGVISKKPTIDLKNDIKIQW
jgi:hypothetical protein